MITKINLTIANAYLVQGEKPILVDTGAPGSTPAILKALARAGVAPRELALILLTHAHSDHAGSAAVLRAETGAPVAVHQGDGAMLKRGDNGVFLPVGIEAWMSKPFVDLPFPALEPDIIITRGDELTPFGLTADILHTPGHSPGSISLLFENGDAIIGDILRGGIMGGVLLGGRPAYPYFLYDLADKDTIRASVAAVVAYGAQRLYPGHGGPLPRHAVEQWLQRTPS